MFRKITNFLSLSLVLSTLLAGNVFGCACCAEPGTYFMRTAKPDKFVIDLVSEFAFAQKAKLYMTEAGFDTIEGLSAIQKEDEAAMGVMDYIAGGSFANKTWKLNLKTPKGSTAALTLPMPLKFTEQKADIHDVEDRPNGPWLYKELRFEGPVSNATGFARAGFVRGTTYSLVFQGRGVGCDEVEDFTHWHLSIDGPKAGYAFYGKLSSGRKPDSESAKLGAPSMLDTLGLK